MTIGEYISSYVQEHQISLNELARQCGISKGYISMIVKGVNPSTKEPIIPSIKIMQKLAVGTGISLDGLFRKVDSYVDLRDVDLPSAPAAATDPLLPLSQEEQSIIRRYRVVDDSTKSAVCAVLGVERQEGEGLYGLEIDA